MHNRKGKLSQKINSWEDSLVFIQLYTTTTFPSQTWWFLTIILALLIEAEARRSKITGSWRPEEITLKLLALRREKNETGMVVQACILYQLLGRWGRKIMSLRPETWKPVSKSTTKRKQIKKNTTPSSSVLPCPLSKNSNLSKLNNSVSPFSEWRNL